MAKGLEYSEKSREKLLNGVAKLARAVSVTLGPRGRNVIIDRKFGSPLITKDGVTVAKEIRLEDAYENMGAQLIKEAATRTNTAAGDGTTTATVLAYAIAKEGVKMVASGHDPISIKRGIDEGIRISIAAIDELKVDVQTKEDILNIATISANGDTEIGMQIADAIEHVGNDGVVTVEESRSIETYVDYVEGMQFDRGYMSPYFVNDDHQNCILETPYLLITNKTIANIKQIVPLLEMVQRQNRPLFIIADNVEPVVMSALIINNMKGVLRSCVIRTPGYGEGRFENLKDIAILTGGTYIDEGAGMEFSDISIDKLGQAGRIKITASDTTIIEGAGSPEALKTRLENLRTMLADASSDYEKEKIQEQIAKLSGGVAILNVGAASEVEMKEKKHRVEDALSATRAAIEGGIVPGGGLALLCARKSLEAFPFKAEAHNESFFAGLRIVTKALEEPMRIIAENAGISGDVVVDRAISNINTATTVDAYEGFNASTLVWVRMFTAGIIDPAKVTKAALQNAGSVAGMLLTTECAIIDLPEPEQSMPQMPEM